MFVDNIRITVKAGDGGNGAVHFRREKYVPRGGPDGGDGGKGGDVVLVVDPHTDDLRTFFYQPNHRAENGSNGGGQRKTGRSGRDVVLKVPAGTLVFRESGDGTGAEADEVPEDGDDAADDIFEPDAPGDDAAEALGGSRELVADLVEPGQRFVLCRGGAGGLGNAQFKSATNQTPRENTPGGPGEDGEFRLEVRQIADAGLVGFPNAGKSTLLGRISAAHPKVAAYPFTTLQPSVGVVEFDGFMRATVADIPGLIEGAHENVGLGHDFLRHIMRCRLLLFVIDMAGSEGREPIEDLATLRREVSLYDEILARKPWLVVANKMDLEEAGEKLAAFRTRFPKQEIIPISAQEGEGIETLKHRLCEIVGRRPG